MLVVFFLGAALLPVADGVASSSSTVRYPCRRGPDGIEQLVGADDRGARVTGCMSGTVPVRAQHATGITREQTAASGRAFYWYFPSTVKTDRLLVWMMGGPGCSSVPAIFQWNGPFTWDPSAKGSSPYETPACLEAGVPTETCANLTKLPKLLPNPTSWHHLANVLYIEQPLGTGYSTTDTAAPVGSTTYQQGLMRDEWQVGTQIREVLATLWTDVLTPGNLQGQRPSKLFLVSPSYGGHYVPAAAAALLRLPISGLELSGYAIGNGLVAAQYQFPAYIDYSEWLLAAGSNLTCPDRTGAGQVSLLTPEIEARLRTNVASLRAAFGSAADLTSIVAECMRNPHAKVRDGVSVCAALMPAAFGVPTGSGKPLFGGGLPGALGQQIGVDFQVMNVCPGNARAGGEVGYNFQYTLTLLRDKDVQRKLGVPNHQDVEANNSTTAWSYQLCDAGTYTAFNPDDIMSSTAHDIRFALDNGVHVLAYSGDLDFNCNWLGGWAWTQNQPWKHQHAFRSEVDDMMQKPYNTDEGELVGWLHTFRNFAFMRVSGAGHLVAMDRPKAASFLIDQFMDGRLFDSGSLIRPEAPVSMCHADHDCAQLGHLLCKNETCVAGGCRLDAPGICETLGADYCNLGIGHCEQFLKVPCSSDDRCAAVLGGDSPDERYRCIRGSCGLATSADSGASKVAETVLLV